MAIFRTKRKDNFCIIPNALLNDENLTFKSKGLLCYLLSKPDNWNVNPKQLSFAKDGRDSIYSGLQELMSAKYIIRVRVKDESGKFGGFEYHVHEEPQTEIPSPFPENTETVLPFPENPDINKNCSLINTIDNNTVDTHEKLKKIKDTKERKIEFCKKLIEWVKLNNGKYPKRLYVAFTKYWLETNHSGKKMRFEDEKFFEIGRRLSTFFQNTKQQDLQEYWETEDKIPSINQLLLQLL